MQTNPYKFQTSQSFLPIFSQPLPVLYKLSKQSTDHVSLLIFKGVFVGGYIGLNSSSTITFWVENRVIVPSVEIDFLSTQSSYPTA